MVQYVVRDFMADTLVCKGCGDNFVYPNLVGGDGWVGGSLGVMGVGLG